MCSSDLGTPPKQLMGWVLLSIGLVLVVEGLAYVLAPSLIDRKSVV